MNFAQFFLKKKTQRQTIRDRIDQKMLLRYLASFFALVLAVDVQATVGDLKKKPVKGAKEAKEVAGCPCAGNKPRKEPFYECELHPLISDISDTCKTFSYSSTSSSTACKSSSSSSSDHCCHPCKSESSSSCTNSYLEERCQKRVLADWDFCRKFPQLEGKWKDWSYWQYGCITANGGTFEKAGKGGYLDTSVYSVTAPQSTPYWADHYKYFIYADMPTNIPERGVTTFEFKARVTTNGKGCRKFPFPPENVNSMEDARLASGGFRVFEPNTGMNFAFHITNEIVYAVYERNVTIAGISGFSYFIPVRPRKPKQMHHMKIIVNATMKTVSWMLDGREVLKVDRVGATLKCQKLHMVNNMGGNDIVLFPRKLYYGFGSFTFLDYYPPCRPSCKTENSCNFPCVREGLVRTSVNPALPQYDPILGPPNLAHYYDNFSKDTSRLWGQGSQTWIRNIRVSQELCYNVRHMGRIPLTQ